MKNGLMLIVALCFMMGTITAHAKSKPWRANNHTGYKVKVFWTAAGCAGVKPSFCGFGAVPTVCKTKILQPGESASYKFPGGTSNQKKYAQMEAYKDEYTSGMCYNNTTTSRKKNGISFDKNADIPVRWYHD